MLWSPGVLQKRKRFRVLKIDRTQLRDLDIVDDGIEYSRTEIEVMTRPSCSVRQLHASNTI